MLNITIHFVDKVTRSFQDDIVQNNKVIYYRFHGVPDLYRSPYSLEKLCNVKAEAEANNKVKEAFIYYNNDIEVLAIQNALDMEKFV